MSILLMNKLTLSKSNLDFYFYAPKSLFFLKGISGIFMIKLPKKYYHYNYANGIYFFFLEKKFFSNFIAKLHISVEKHIYFYYARLRLRGLGYRFRKMTKNLYRIFMGRTNYVYFHVPSDIFIKLRRRRAFILSSDFNLLRNVVAHFLLLKEWSPYDFSGVYYPRQLLIVKPGKKRF